MGINLGNLEENTAPLNSTQVGPVSTGISLNLQKNDILDLTKRNPGLTKVNLGAGWDVSGIGTDFDLDISAFALHENGKIASAADIVYFNNKNIPGVTLNGDNRTGAGDGDDEVISLDLSRIDPSIKKIVFAVTIYDAMNRHQTFGMVNNSYVRLLDVSNGERQLCIYQLKEDYSTSTAVIAAELIRNGAD